MFKRLLAAAIVTGLACSQMTGLAAQKSAPEGYAGVEFYGSSQISKKELEKELGLKIGASYQSGAKAIERLHRRLDERKLKNSVDLVREDGVYYVVVDIADAGSVKEPYRLLVTPHHVRLSSELVFQTFDELMLRRAQMAEQSRPVTETFENGVKYFSDEPCNQFAEKLLKQVPSLRRQLLEVVASDPNPVRRSNAIEVLNWDQRPADDCEALMPAVNDASEQVRVSAARFIGPRIKLLSDNFPIPDLVEAFSHQLLRPSHVDRVLALRCLTEIARTHPFAIHAIKEFDESTLKQFESLSVVNSVKQASEQLLTLCEQAPSKPVRHESGQNSDNSF